MEHENLVCMPLPPVEGVMVELGELDEVTGGVVA
jgi:hypothetical protein